MSDTWSISSWRLEQSTRWCSCYCSCSCSDGHHLGRKQLRSAEGQVRRTSWPTGSITESACGPSAPGRGEAPNLRDGGPLPCTRSGPELLVGHLLDLAPPRGLPPPPPPPGPRLDPLGAGISAGGTRLEVPGAGRTLAQRVRSSRRATSAPRRGCNAGFNFPDPRRGPRFLPRGPGAAQRPLAPADSPRRRTDSCTLRPLFPSPPHPTPITFKKKKRTHRCKADILMPLT